MLISAPAGEVRQCDVRGNGGDGVQVSASASGAACVETWLRDNGGSGATAAAASTRMLDNRAAFNAADALALSGASDATVSGNRLAVNFGAGIFAENAPGAAIADNLSGASHGQGPHLDRCDDTAATGNTLEDNNGYGIFLRRSVGTDFDAAAGLQTPPGDNAVSGNRKGDVFIRPD